MAFIPLMVPDIQQQDIDAVVEVLTSGMLIQGKHVEALESSIAQYVGVKHAIAVSNGTATMHLILKAWGIGPGDEVIVPALSYIATANVVELVGATCVFVDVDERSFTIDVDKIEAAITSRTKVIIPVHEFGMCANIDSIIELASKHNILVLEDAACALGATLNGRFSGSFGDAGSFSFHPRKAITSGEGGIITTNDDALAHKLRILRNHGVEMNDGQMDFVEAGFNYRLTDFQAALVHSQFQRLEKILNYKNELADIYFENLNQDKYFVPIVADGKRHTWQSFHILLPDNSDRSSIISNLKEKGIGVNYGAQCIPYMDYYQKKYGLDCRMQFPNAMRAFEYGLVLPLYERLTKEQIEMIAAALNDIKAD